MEHAISTFLNELLTALAKATPIILKKLVLLGILWATYKPFKNFCFRAFRKFLSLKKLDELLVHFLESLLNIAIIMFYILDVIQIIGIEMTSVLALLGSIGIGVGLALKGSLSDLAGGMQILASRYFTKGDYIVTCGVEGIVQRITFLYTVLHTVDNKFVVVPNGKLSGEVIINAGANLERRVDSVFSVSYDTSIDKVKEILREIAENHPLVLKDKDIFVRLSKHNASSLDFTMRVWAKKDHYWDVFFDLQETVKKRFDQEGIEIPYNKIDVYQK
ncbi:mechanosensitive ion channel [Cetobacterium sp. 8H]|uniref:mechanosensitive ion channel family protein n=1 Tax=Cetobacterium sp. 8H TaxID=2759681 RepID=UPI00163BDBE9|nr:mechanosensitive ion channel domain-containing protein [Cetobacterium sp. 8H]MBC2850777.1 mechanosensitive ion channel [Cetobacterium sp. 8H]